MFCIVHIVPYEIAQVNRARDFIEDFLQRMADACAGLTDYNTYATLRYTNMELIMTRYRPPQKPTLVLTAVQKEEFAALAELASKVRKFCLFRFEEDKDLTKAGLESLLRSKKPFPLPPISGPVIEHAISTVYIQWRDYQKGAKPKPGVILPGEPFQVRLWNPSIGTIDKDGFTTTLLTGKVCFALPGVLKDPTGVQAISAKNDRGVFRTHVSMGSSVKTATVETMKEEY